MTTPASQPFPQRGRLWWLPPHGRGNGLDDDSWAPVLEVDGRIADALLSAFGSAGVPAYAAPTASMDLLAAARRGGRSSSGHGKIGPGDEARLDRLTGLMASTGFPTGGS